jgi:2-phospho-L-lactate/phosphoenolpyruvate guanylyltransferase
MPEPIRARMPGWTVVVPLKPPAIGKSRLAVLAEDRPGMARAIAQDTLAAACACHRVDEVVVVSADRSWELPEGARLVPEPRPTTIDDAVARGLDTVSGQAPRAVLLGDLSGLDAGDLAEALDAADHLDRGLVRDVEGTGTTLVTARAGIPLVTAFGPASALHHRHLDYVDLPVRGSSTLRRDVDTADHLAGTLGPRASSLVRAVWLPRLQVSVSG